MISLILQWCVRARPSEGHQFTLVDGELRIGTDVYALGFPKNLTVKDAEGSNNGFTANAGAVTALNQVVEYDSGPIGNMIRTDASVDSGNSGGPLISRSGEVVGLVSGGRMTEDGAPVNGWGYAVTASRIAEAVEEWNERSTMVGLKSCADAPAPDGTTVYSEVNSSHDQEQVSPTAWWPMARRSTAEITDPRTRSSREVFATGLEVSHIGPKALKLHIGSRCLSMTFKARVMNWWPGSGLRRRKIPNAIALREPPAKRVRSGPWTTPCSGTAPDGSWRTLTASWHRGLYCRDETPR